MNIHSACVVSKFLVLVSNVIVYRSLKHSLCTWQQTRTFKANHWVISVPKWVFCLSWRRTWCCINQADLHQDQEFSQVVCKVKAQAQRPVCGILHDIYSITGWSYIVLIRHIQYPFYVIVLSLIVGFHMLKPGSLILIDLGQITAANMVLGHSNCRLYVQS